MKTEGESTPATSQTPSTQYQSTQWSGAQIPIDPALQQQPQQATPTQYAHYPGFSTHYPQAAYTAHYPYASASQPQPQSQSTTTTRQSAQQGGSTDSADIASLSDALGSAGVDLKAEEESLQRSHEPQSYRNFEDRSRKQPVKPSFDTRFIGPTMRTIGTQHKVTKIPEDSVNYLSLALRMRLQELITSMIAASRHRTDTDLERSVSLYKDGSPMWSLVVRSDVMRQLAALEKVEREEETKARRERKERAEVAAHAAALAAQASGGGAMMTDGTFEDAEGGGAKKKRRKEGPGVTARNMSEDVRKKMSNAVASQAAGLGGKYAWMNAANAPSNTSKPKPATPAGSGAAGTPATTTAPAAGAGGSWARPYVSTKKTATAQAAAEEDTRTTVTIRDAIFVVEKERGHGGGRGAARAWM